ncbi:MAG: M4 family metallopeptidase [Prevotella sp.]|nr:M4 family metallopeptidase [Prevotella sp.]
MKRIVTAISLCALVLSASAQLQTDNALPNLTQSDFTVVERNSDGTIKYVRYAKADDNIPANANEFFSTTLKKRDADDFVLNKSKDNNYDMHFECYQQYYKGVLVVDGFYNFSFKHGRMKRARGHYVNVAGIDLKPSFTKDEAINHYASYFGIRNNDTIKSYVDLMIKEVSNPSENETVVALVYRVYLQTKNIGEGYIGYIDAHTGKLLYKENAYIDYSTTGQFYTYYNSSSNPKSAITDCQNNNYYLIDTTHGYGIYTNHGNSNPFTDTDNIWTQTGMAPYGIALDVHWTMQEIYELMSSVWNHNGYNGNGHQIVSLIYDSSVAAYSGIDDWFVFGISPGNTIYGPKGSVDVIGHEYGHALLYNSTGLFGGTAIHEGLADIWGIIFEKHITPSANYWKTGEQIMINGNSCERNFQNPSDATAHTQISSTYGYGAFNSTDSHIKGGLLPYWFYLLVNGGNGTNGANNSYQLIPVGFDLAEDLFIYTTLHTNYLSGNLSFQDVAYAFIDAAEENYDGFLVEQVRNAFYAVGLYYEPQHIYTQSYSPGSATYYVYGNSNCSVSWSYTHSSGNMPSLIPNYSNHTCTVNTSSSFSGYLNATILCGGCSATYSRYITGNASPSSAGGDVMQVIPIDGSHYQISAGSGYESASIRVYDASSLQMKVAETQISDNYVLDTSSWKHGLYIVEMTIGNKTYTTKITKK